jgi:hypothetical protein
VVALARGGALETVKNGHTGLLFPEPTAESLAETLRAAFRWNFDPSRIRDHAEGFSREQHAARLRAVIDDTLASPAGAAMVKRYNRLLVAFYVLTDALLAMWAFVLAYGVRFESGLIPVPKGYPPLEQYLARAAVRGRAHTARVPDPGRLPPAPRPLARRRLLRGAHRQHPLGRLRRGLDPVRPGLLRLGRRAEHRGPTRCRSSCGRCSWCSAFAFTYGSREFVRELLERRWRAGIGLKRVLIAGAGDLGRLVADRILQHRELGYQVIGFIDDRAGGDHIGYRGLPLLGTLAEVADIAQRERIDHLYVALALDEHPKLLDLMDTANRECIDVKVVPDLLQFIALRRASRTSTASRSSTSTTCRCRASTPG